uniref:Ribosomal_L30 domain-containing protein n=1 Tax=Macrostomum lignano TaxID=282301 RepID=A0A1I8F4Q7_9PLAT
MIGFKRAAAAAPARPGLKSGSQPAATSPALGQLAAAALPSLTRCDGLVAMATELSETELQRAGPSNDLSCFASSVPTFSFIHLAIAPPLAPMSYRSATDLLTEPGSSRAPECLTLSSSGSAGGCSRFGRPAATRALRQQARQQLQQQAAATVNSESCWPTLRLNPGAERKAAARSTNNNTTEMQCGLSDIQRHSSGGHRTTVITRLTSEMATSGGILDANFEPGQPGQRGLVAGCLQRQRQLAVDSPYAPPDSQQRRASRASKDKLLTDSDSRDAGIGDKRNQPKEGSVIGCMNVFADVMKREFVVLMTDSVIEAFLIEPSQFRAIARRTGCEIEVTRRILNRRVGAHRWVKYLVLTIKGPTCTAIDQCDRLMVKVFPPYKVRKEYLEPAPRTGATADRLGDMRLQTPFGPDPYRPLENTPWKYADWRLFRGMLEPRNLAVEHTIQHVYPEWGTEISNSVEPEHKWEAGRDYAPGLGEADGSGAQRPRQKPQAGGGAAVCGEHLKCWWSCCT